MSIFKRFRGLTATGIAPLVVMSLATPLAFAQNANERYSGVASVSDVDGNGYGDHAVVKWHPGKKKYFVYITDGFTGNYIDKYSFGSVPVQGLLGIEDVNGNKQREIAVLRVNKKGKSFVRVRDAASGEDLSDSFVAGGVQKPKAMAVVSDISGNEGQEYAVLFTNKNTTASQVRIRDARTGRFVSNVEVFEGRIRAQALGVLPSIDVNDNDEIAVMGTDTRNGQVRVRLIDSLTGQSINDVIFITGSGRRAQGMTILSDLNENGSSEISVLYVRKDDGSIRVLTKDAQTGADISDHEYFGEDFTPLGITTVKNLDGPESGFDGIAVMAKRANGEVRVRVRLPDSGEQLALTTYHDRRYTTQQMLQLADLDEDGVGDMGVMFTNKSTGTARVRIRNPITRANLINTQIVGGDGNIPPIALAGEDVAVTRGFAVSLDGTDSFDVDTNKSLKYEWKQVSGPDVTGGRGSLRGKRPLFAAPRDVRSVVMKLVVTDSGGLVGEEPIVVNALEDADRAYFVDGDNGSDSTGDGTRENPFASPYNALNAATDRQDIYVMTRRDGQRYNEGRSYWFARRGVSLYGGYDKNWVRDRVGNKTSMLNTSTREFGLYMDEVSEDTWVSGFRIQHSPSNTTNVYGIIAGEGGDAHLYIEDNVVSTSSGRTTDGTTPPGSAYGIWGCYLRNITIRDNEVRPGAGGWANGRRSNYGEAAANGDDGSNGSATTGGDGGSGTPGYNGGGGGNAGTGAGSNGRGGGTGNAPSGSSGGSGGAGGSGNTSDNGSVGGGGRGGNGGNGGNGFTGSHEINSCGLYVIDAGSQGGGGVAGYGGGGGGGGEATISGVNGGGGGGGGEGGAPGAGGLGGYNGGASIGIAVGNADGVTIERNQVVANRGGRGGSGGLGQPSGVGGTGGNGASGNSGVGTGGNGGHGGGGGRGGFGGMGGGGAGGPSYGIVLGNISAEQLRDNNITVSAGGPGSISGGAPGIGGTSGAGGGTGGAGGGGVTPERNGTPAANGNGRTGDSAPTRDWQSQ